MAEDRQPQSLALTGGLSNTSTAPAQCSPGLWKLLTEGEDGGSAIRLIALNPKLRAEAEEVCPRLVAMATRLPDDEAQDSAIMEVLIRHAPGFGLQAKHASEWAEIFDGYLDTLAPLPVLSIEEAFARWKRNELYPKDIGRHSFYPRANELFGLASDHWHKIRAAAWRAKRALEKIEAEKPRTTPEEAEVIAAGLRDLMKQIGKPKVVLSDKPYPGLSQGQAAERIRKAQLETPHAAPDGLGEIL